MKKLIAVLMALAFAVAITPLAFAAEEVKAPAGMPLSAEEKDQLEKAGKKATKAKGKAEDAAKKAPLSAEEKAQIADTKKKATKAKGKAEDPAKKAPLSAEEKGQLEDAKKKSTADKMKEKKAAEEKAPAEKK